MRGIEHWERAEELADHANVALTRDGDRAEAQTLTALAQVHADLAHVAALTGWDTARSTSSPGHGPYAEVPVR